MAPNTASRMAGRTATTRKEVCAAMPSTSFSLSPVNALKAVSPPATLILVMSKIPPIHGSTNLIERVPAVPINPISKAPPRGNRSEADASIEIGRASCRERVEISEVAEPVKKDMQADLDGKQL